jgi:hypothetical protein
MSDYTKLIINGQEADYFSAQELPLNIKDRITNEEGEPAGSFTRSSLNLPATKNNKLILEGQKGLLPFSIESNGSVKLSGNLQVKGAKYVNDGTKGVKELYKVNLTGGSADWFTLLRGCKLSDLTDEIIVYNEANVTAGFDADPFADVFGFTFVKWYEWEHSRSATEIDGQGNTIDRFLEMPSLYESTPFFFVYRFIEAALNSVGYNLKSDFLESEYFRRAIMLVPLPAKMPEEYGERLLNAQASRATTTITPATGFLTTFEYNTYIDPPLTPGAWNPLLYEYTTPEAGYYEIEVGATYGPEIGVTSYAYAQIVAINGALFPIYAGGAGFGDSDLVRPFPAGESRSNSSVFQLNKGDKVTVLQLAFTNTDFTILDSYVSITGEALRGEGMRIDFKSLLKSYECLEMIKDVFKIFNLVAATNQENRTVKIEPADLYRYKERLTITNEIREGFYFKNQNIDYSQKIDYKTKPEEKYKKLQGQFNYIWQSDDDETTKSVEENEPFLIYEGQFFPGNGADLSKRKTIETEFFAKTIHAFDNFARYPNTTINPQFPLIYPNDYVFDPTATLEDAEYDVTPRLLWFAGQRGGIDGYIEVFETGIQTEVPAAFMVNYNDITGLDPNFSFCTEIINNTPVPGLLEDFHIHRLERTSQREELKANVLQSSIERDNFSFRNRVIIDEKRYIVQETETVNPLQRQPAIFIFVLDRFANEETKNKIVNSNLNGVVSLFR